MPKKFNKKGSDKAMKGAEGHMYSHALGKTGIPNSPLSRRLVSKTDKAISRRIKRNERIKVKKEIDESQNQEHS